MARKLLWAAAAVAGLYLITRRPKRYHADELHNLFWDAEKGRWRTDEEVRSILREHPEYVPEPLTSEEARVLAYLAEIEAAADRFDIDPSLIAAIISRESSGEPDARGAVGEYGLMQLRASTAALMGYTGNPDQLLNPSLNIRYGTAYLRRQFDRYSQERDTVQFAVAAYNAGTAHYERGRFANQAYVDSVVQYRWPRYARLINRIHGIYGPPAPLPLDAFGRACPSCNGRFNYGR